MEETGLQKSHLMGKLSPDTHMKERQQREQITTVLKQSMNITGEKIWSESHRKTRKPVKQKKQKLYMTEDIFQSRSMQETARAGNL